jgi:hypothetical protein
MSTGTPPQDTTAPVVTTSVDPASPTGADGWYTGPVTVTATATDDSGAEPVLQVSVDGGAWADYAAQTLTDDGSHSLRFRAADAAGNVSDPIIVDVKIDSVVPTAAATVDAVARTVSLTGTDTGSGVARLEYRVDDAADWTAVDGSPAVATVGAAAATVQYRAVDKAGNLGATETATVPAAGGPQATIEITSAGEPSADGWYNQKVLVTITAPAGMVAQYRVDGGDWKAAKKPFTVAANGVHTIDHRLLSSNVVVEGSAASVCVKIDRQVPTATVTRSPAATGTPRNPITLTFSATDALSGVAGIEYKVNQGDWTAVGGGEPVVLNTVGDYVVSYRSRDAAGNVSKERSTTASISADVPPAVTARPGKVRPGEYLTLNLAGFDRFDTVRITLGDAALGMVFTDVKGGGKVTLAVPAGTPAGAATVTATGNDGEPTATAQVTVQ